MIVMVEWVLRVSRQSSFIYVLFGLNGFEKRYKKRYKIANDDMMTYNISYSLNTILGIFVPILMACS